MKIPSVLRHRGLRPSTMKARLRRRLNLSDISHSRLRRFLAGIEGRPPVALPALAPTTIALVVPCYRHAAFLPETLESIASQTRPPDEVAFVDDGSPDATGDLLRAFIAGHPGLAGGRVTLLTNERNLGQAASLNRGISATASELVMILNDDDYLMHDAVEVMLGLFAANPGVALIGATNVGFAGEGTLAGMSKLSRDHVRSGEPLTIRQPGEVASYRHPDDLNMTHSASCFYRAAWGAVGGYYTDKRRRVVPYSDRDFQLRVNSLWPAATSYALPLVFWRNDSSVDRNLNS